MSQQNIDSVRRGFEVINSQDVDRILELTHPDFEVKVPPELSAEPDTYRGHAGMRRYWDSFQDAMEEIHFEPERLWDAGDKVVVAMHITAKGRRTAIAVEQRTAAVWTLHDGKIMHIQVYPSLSEALDAVGLAE